MADDGLGPALDVPTGDIEEGEPERFIPERAEPDEPDAPKRPEWLNGADDEIAEYVRGKGWDNPLKAVQSQREAEKQMRAAEAERDQLRRLVQEMEQGEPGDEQPGGQYGPDIDNDPLVRDLAAIDGAYEEGQIDFRQRAALQAQIMRAVAAEYAQGAAQEAAAPIQGRLHKEDLERAAAEMEMTYPDFRDLSGEVVKEIESNPLFASNPAFRDSADGIRAAYGLVQQRRQAAHLQEQQNAQSAEFLSGGGRGRVSAASAADVILKRIDAAGHRPNDGI